MKIGIIITTIIIAINSTAQEITISFNNLSVQTVVEQYGMMTGKRVDLVQGEHQPISLKLEKVPVNEALQKIETALKERNLQLYKINDNHLVASWINVPEKKPETTYVPVETTESEK